MLIGILGLLTSAAAKSFSDTITFGVNLAVMTNLVQFASNVTTEKRANISPAWKKWGPFYIIVLASAASMLDICRTIVLDSDNPVLIQPGGAAGGFTFDQCTYTATAVPLSPLEQGAASCPTAPMPVQEVGAVNTRVDAFLKGAVADQICSVAGWLTLVLTIIGFAWLSDTLAWLRWKWMQVQHEGLKEALLSAEEDPTSCKACKADGSGCTA